MRCYFRNNVEIFSGDRYSVDNWSNGETAKLDIYPVSVDDEGEYRCEVDTTEGETNTTLATLHVFTDASNDRPRFIQPLQNQQTYEGNSTTLKCQIQGKFT